MSNENEVYIIEDIHPRDAHNQSRDMYIGKKFYNPKFDSREWIAGWKGTSGGDVEGGLDNTIFLAVKVRKVENKYLSGVV